MGICRKFLSFLVVIMIGLWALSAQAADDGFSTAKKIETRYFTLSIGPGVDERLLVPTLNLRPEQIVLAGQPVSDPNSIADLLDGLFGWASGVLDMQLYSYKGSIKVTATPDQLQAVYRKLYGQESHSEKGFYIYDLNTIYIAAPDFTKEILGHEVGHAIISNFFVVQPPAKVQEVLAGYIEYQLRKTAKRP